MFRPGAQIGSYEIVSSIGAAGESEVYRARDTQRGVDVVLRPLPEAVAAKRDAVERMERDSRLLETLDHPNIAGLHAVEESGGTQFLVTDLVSGETLAERLRRGPLSVGDALAVALGIAAALEAAHEKGVLHRDLNPSNIRVTPDAQARVLNFGLANVFAGGAPANAIDPSQSPTMSATMTRSGSFSGTAAYMSPEQVRGEAGDAGSDVWALGCVLYEMLAGRAAFAGQSESEVRAAILKSDPEWSRLPAHLHPRIRYLLERCLEKRTACRSSDMAGVRADIEKTLEDPAEASTAAARTWSRRLLPWFAAIVLAGFLGIGGSWALRSDAPSPVVRFGMWTSRPGGISQALQAASPELEISRDGARIAFRGVDGGLYLRDRGDITPRPVRITEKTGVLYAPLFSSDGRELYYVDIPLSPSIPPAVVRVLPRELATGQIPAPGLNLNKVPVDGGAPTPVLTGRDEELLDANWSANDTILFVDSRGKIQTISANGGTAVTLLDASGARFPQLLPDGKRVLYSTGSLVITPGGSTVSSGQIVVQSLVDPKDRRVVWEGGTHARYIEATGHIVYQGLTHPGLWAFTFDLGGLKKTGDPVPLVEDSIVDFALSDTGSLAYAVASGLNLTSPDASNGANILGLVSLNGTVTRRLRTDPGQYRNPRVSPDGKRVAYESVNRTGGSDVWVYDLDGDSPKRLTLDGTNIYPIWKDDTHVTFAAKREGVWGVYTQPTDPGATAELVVGAPRGMVYRPQTWSPSGPGKSDRALVLVFAAESADARTGRLAMWVSGSKVSEIAPAEPGSNEFGASLSPNGAWLAYIASCQSPLGCARVQRFPPVPGSSFQIRLSDSWVQFAPNGGALLTSRPNAMFAWNVNSNSTGGRIDFSGPRAFPLNGFAVAGDNRSFDLRGPGGQELVMVIPANQQVTQQGGQNPMNSLSSRIDFVHNFFKILRERVHPSGDR